MANILRYTALNISPEPDLPLHLIESILKQSLAYSLILLPVPYYLGRSGSVSFFPTYLIGVSVLLLWCYQVWCYQVWCYRKSRLCNLSECAVFGFLVYMSVTTLWSGEPLSLFLYFGYGLLLMAFLKSFALVQTLHFDVFRWFRLSLIISAVSSACISIYIFKSAAPDISSDSRLQAIGRLSNPVVGGLSYGAALIFTCSAIVDTQSRVARLLLFLSTCILILVIIYTGTRSVWVGLFAGLCMLLLSSPQLTVRRKVTIMLLSLAGIIMLSALLWHSKDSALHSAIFARSTSLRPEIWAEVLKQMMSGGGRLVSGYGINADESVTYQAFTFAHPHSIYLATLFYGGSIGLGLFMLMLLRICYSSIQNRSHAYFIYILPLLTYGVTCLLFDGNRPLEKIDFTWFLIWLPIGLAMAQEHKSTSPQGGLQSRLSVKTLS